MSTPSIPVGPVEREPLGFHPHEAQAAVLRDTLRAAGVEMGAYDQRIADWLARWDWSTIAVIISWVARAAQHEPAPTVALPSRFDASPADVDQHLRRILADDVHLRYQQAIGCQAVTEAAKDVRVEVVLPDAPDAKAWREAADYIDPALHGGPYPAQLLCSRHDGFGPCPGAPACTPAEITKDTR